MAKKVRIEVEIDALLSISYYHGGDLLTIAMRSDSAEEDTTENITDLRADELDEFIEELVKARDVLFSKPKPEEEPKKTG